MLRGGKARKVLALMIILAVTVMYLPLNSARAETADEESGKENVIYHETFADGQGKVKQSGNAVLTPVKDMVFQGNYDGAALYVSNRTNNWDAADLNYDDLGLEDGKTYSITVTGYVYEKEAVPENAEAWIQQISSYKIIARAPFKAGEAFNLTGEFTVDRKKDSAVRILTDEGDSKKVPFYIGEIIITSREEKEKVVYHETFENGPGKVVQSGGANLKQVTGKVFEGNEDGAALYVSNRKNNWDGADFFFSEIGLEEGKTYTVTVTGYVDSDVEVPEGAKFFLQPVGNEYGWLGGADFVAGKAFTVIGKLTVGEMDVDRIRVQSNDEGASVPFYIGDIRITTKVSSGDEEPLPPAEPFTAIDFEDGTNGGFTARGGVETLTVTDEANHTEGGKYALKVENRQQNWQGPSLRVEKYIDQGSEYKVSVWVKLIDPASTQLILSTQIGEDSDANYVNLVNKSVSVNDGWVLLEGTYRYSNIRSGYVTIYVESNSATASFYIDDVNFEKIGSAPVEIEKDLQPIKDVYKDHFLIGTAISAEDLEGVRYELMTMHFNVATAGNAMKPDALQREKGKFTFDAADKMVDTILSSGMNMHGHTLLWYQQTPDWMYQNDDGTPLSREEALENMRNHIRTVVEHFGDKVISWDVVNEGMNDNPSNPSDWRASLRQSGWYKAIGEDYIEQAFLAAREVLDEHPDWNIKLYYNDYNLDNQNKATAVYNMVKELNEKYGKDHPGKLLIDGIGMQGHYQVNTNPVNVELSLKRFIELGVEVSISELDVMAGENYQLTEKQSKAQAYLYAQLFRIFRENSEHIARVTLWGMDDGTSWRASNNPLLFDRNLKAKPAYYAVIDPDTYIEENKPDTTEANRSTAKYGTPVIDGEVDDVWKKSEVMKISRYQTAWQGATGTARALWDENNLYVLIQVNDTELDKGSANPWEQDSIEVFVDENNAKTSYYQDDDGQYRVNYENEATFNPESIKEGFESAVKVNGTNYTVEVKIPFRKIRPAADTEIGFDVQINDGRNGARQSIATWNDTTGNAYQDTSVFGILTLVREKPSSTSSSAGVSSPVDESGRIVTGPKQISSDGETVTAVTSFDSKAFEDAMKKVQADEKGIKTVEVIISRARNAKIYELVMPAEILSAQDDNVRIKVKTELAEVLLPGNMLAGLEADNNGSGNGKVSLLISKSVLQNVDDETRSAIGDRPVISIELRGGGNPIHWNNPDTPVAVSIPYSPSEEELDNPELIAVWYIDSDGNVSSVTSGRYNPETGMVTFNINHFSTFAVVYVDKDFADLNVADEVKHAVKVLTAKGVVEGVSDDRFAPEDSITRADLLYYLMRALDIDAGYDGNFDDIGPDAYYYKEIAVAKALGITLGCGNNMFRPDEAVTRQDMMVLTYRALRLLNEIESRGTEKDLDKFTDKLLVADYAKESIVTLILEGIVGDTGPDINPRGHVTRAEAALLLYRIYNRQ